MPRPRRKGRERCNYTERHYQQLKDGWFGFGGFSGCCYPPSRVPPEVMAAAREGWEQLRDEIMEAWIAERPGTRPWAWWEWDAPERRRCIEGPGHHCMRNPNAPEWTKRLTFGVPTVLGGDDFDNPDSVYESERDYLERLGFIDFHERQLLERADSQPL